MLQAAGLGWMPDGHACHQKPKRVESEIQTCLNMLLSYSLYWAAASNYSEGNLVNIAGEPQHLQQDTSSQGNCLSSVQDSQTSWSSALFNTWCACLQLSSTCGLLYPPLARLHVRLSRL